MLQLFFLLLRITIRAIGQKSYFSEFSKNLRQYFFFHLKKIDHSPKIRTKKKQISAWSMMMKKTNFINCWQKKNVNCIKKSNKTRQMLLKISCQKRSAKNSSKDGIFVKIITNFSKRLRKIGIRHKIAVEMSISSH